MEKRTIYYKNGSIKYEGDFINDKAEGNGKYIKEDGNYYIGELKNNLKHGKGKLYYKNGNIKYEGDFINDKFAGNGKFYYRLAFFRIRESKSLSFYYCDKFINVKNNTKT